MVDFAFPRNNEISLTFIIGVAVDCMSPRWVVLGSKRLFISSFGVTLLSMLSKTKSCSPNYSLSNSACHIFSNQESIVIIILEPFITVVLQMGR